MSIRMHQERMCVHLVFFNTLPHVRQAKKRTTATTLQKSIAIYYHAPPIASGRLRCFTCLSFRSAWIYQGPDSDCQERRTQAARSARQQQQQQQVLLVEFCFHYYIYINVPSVFLCSFVRQILFRKQCSSLRWRALLTHREVFIFFYYIAHASGTLLALPNSIPLPDHGSLRISVALQSATWDGRAAGAW